MFGKIYIITNSINDKVYIGLTIQTIEERFKEHCRKGSSRQEKNMQIKRAIHKYGKENFSIKELETCKAELLNEREIYYISLYNSYKKGYNSTIGGLDGAKPLKLKEKIQNECILLYKIGFSLREIAKQYNVDKQTIKHILEINNIRLRETRTYKYSLKERLAILADLNTMTRKEVINKWKISKSYLSQLINGKRRI